MLSSRRLTRAVTLLTRYERRGEYCLTLILSHYETLALIARLTLILLMDVRPIHTIH